ncbi:MAG: dienelactone hydrolase family protein [Leptolyngbyaceae bacterium]|nr:dienelactone hydrolase family protein [Leptolyngbyaceae bacterium]
MSIQTRFVRLPSDGVEVDAYLALPDGDGPFPGVVVLQEIFGVNEHIRDITERFAKAGYGAIAPALYQRLAPGFETGYTPDDITIGREYKVKTRASELLSDIQAAIAHLTALPQIKSSGVGCIGFCFGGHVAYLAATLPDITATASFYGAGIPSWCPGDEQPTIERTANITGTIYCFFGETDASIPPEDVEAIASKLEQHNISHQIFTYPNAGHGFFCDRRGSYHPEAAKDAWMKVQTFFQAAL